MKISRIENPNNADVLVGMCVVKHLSRVIFRSASFASCNTFVIPIVPLKGLHCFKALSGTLVRLSKGWK